MQKNLTCIICPLGCSLAIQLEDDKIISITGNNCPRGKVYAQNECTNPQRTVTSTVKCTDGSMLSVKTDRTIPKEKMSECMKIINKTVTELPVFVGDIIIENVFGCNIVATQNKELHL